MNCENALQELETLSEERGMVERRLLLGEVALRFKFEVDFEEVQPKEASAAATFAEGPFKLFNC